MEFANENVYRSQDRINLKNKSPFDVSKKYNKKALSDVGNLIHSKASQSTGLKSTHHLKVGYSLDQQIKSPKQLNKTVQKSKNLAVLENMDEDFFTCSCSTHDRDDFAYELPDSLKLTKDEIDIFATRWSNPVPLSTYDDLDASLEIVPVSDDFLMDDENAVNVSFMDMLNESLLYVPEITLPDGE